MSVISSSSIALTYGDEAISNLIHSGLSDIESGDYNSAARNLLFASAASTAAALDREQEEAFSPVMEGSEVSEGACGAARTRATLVSCSADPPPPPPHPPPAEEEEEIEEPVQRRTPSRRRAKHPESEVVDFKSLGGPELGA